MKLIPTSLAVVATLLLVATPQSTKAGTIPTVIPFDDSFNSIFLSGNFTTDVAPLSSATAFTSFFNVDLLGGTGVFQAQIIPDSPVTASPFAFDPFTPVAPLFSFSSAGSDFTFDLLNIDQFSSEQGSILINGSGILSVNSPGSSTLNVDLGFSLFGNEAAAGADNDFIGIITNAPLVPAPVPDGGTTAALFGMGILCLAATRKMVAKKSA